MNTLSRPKSAATAAFALGIALTAIATVWQAQSNHREAVVHFNVTSQRGAEQVVSRIRAYEYGLRGARGAALAAGSIHSLTRQRFIDYSRSRDIDQEFPGARGFGIIKRVAPDDEKDFVARARLDDWPGFSIRQFTSHAGERFVIQYLEPVDRNRDAIGLDIASEPNRRAAAETSMRTGSAVLTEPITLVQATGNPQRSFLLVLPIYRPGQVPQDPGAREAATDGWAFAPLVIDEVLKKVHHGEGAFTLAMRDKATPDARNFFESSGSDQPAAGGLVWQMEIPIYGRTWVAQTRATPVFWARLNQTDPRHVAETGTAFALLLALLAMVYAQSTQRARLVRAAQARHSAIVENSADAVIGVSLDGIVTDWNRGAEQLFGYTGESALGRPVAELLLPPDRAHEDAAIRAAIVRGDSLAPFETTRRRRDGSLVDVSITVSPLIGDNSRCVGFSKTVRDIGESLRMRQALVDLNAGLERQVAERTALLDSALHDLRAILDAVPSMIGYWDKHLVNRVANRTYASWFGLDPASLHGRGMREVIGDELFERNRPHAEGALRGERQTFERFFPKPDGWGVQHSLAHYLPDIVDGEVKGFYVLVHDVSELTENRMRLAAAQRDNAALLHTLHHHASILVTDRDGAIIEVNDSFCCLSGYEREELIGQTPRIVRSDHQPQEFWAGMWRTITQGQSWRGEVCNRAKDGTPYWVDCTVSPFFGDDGEIEKYVSIRTDITARKRFEEALHVTNTRFEIASSSAGIGVWEYDAVSGRLAWDDRMFQIYGCERAIGQDPFPLWRESLHPQDRKRVGNGLAQALDGTRELDMEYRIVLAGGEVRHLRAAARVVRDDDGQALRMTGVNFDVTERVRAELDLRETSTLLQTVLASASGVSIIATDPQLVISVFNAAAERLLGYDSDEMVGQASPVVIHDPQEVEARARELSAQVGHPVAGAQVFIEPSTLGRPREWTYVCKDGSRIPVSLVVTAMHDHTGALFGYVGIAHDVRAQKEYERSLHDAVERANQANQAKSQFLANMSHEIRTPMNAILGMLTLVQRTQLNSRQLDYVTKTEAAAQSLLGLLNDILDFSKVEAGKMELDPRPFQLDRVLRNLAVILSANVADKDVEVLFDIASDVPRDLVGDDMRLQQILINLGGNAIKFTERGEVVVSVRRREAGAAGDGLARLEFSVRDSGIGISPEHQTRIFSGFTQAEASTTRRFGGTGLGLAICQRLVGMMGGDLGLESTVGQGTTFRFTLALPLADPTEEDQARIDGFLVKPITASMLLDAMADAGGMPQSASPTAAPRRLDGMRLLLAEDNLNNQQIARELLEAEGASVQIAGNGNEAVAAVAAAGGDGYDAVLMDLQMPEMDGFEATSRIRHGLGHASLPIIAMTANAMADDREACLAAGMNDRVGKPFDLAKLVDVLRRHTGRAGLKAQADTVLAVQGVPRALLAQAEASGIDLAGALKRTGGNHGAYLRMLRSFLKEAPAVPAALAAHLAQGRREDAARLLHTMKGLAGTLGAVRLMAAVSAVETGLETAVDPADLDELSVQSAFDQACADLGRVADGLRVIEDTGAVAQRSGADDPAEVQALLARLDRLAARLREGDMAAMDLHAEIETLHGHLLGERGRGLDDAVSALDFAQALVHCRELAGEFGAVPTRTP